MANFLNLIMLAAASIGAMAFGVLTAYAIFRVGFAILRPQKPQLAAKTRPETASAL